MNVSFTVALLLAAGCLIALPELALTFLEACWKVVSRGIWVWK